ncbi:MAG: hypothetical protein N2167_09885 [Flavobacteriales bacterium]|nr:hypothetical protein [Flavobacteriales bacterium]
MMNSQAQIFKNTQKRIILVSIGTLRTALPYFFSMAWPFVIFELMNKGTWGECVDTLLIVNLIAHILGWGTKKHLLKKFDLMPDKISESWLENIHSRTLLWVPFSFFILISPFSFLMKIGILLMLTGKCTYESYEPLIEYKEKYTHAIIAELIGFTVGFSLIISIYQKNFMSYEWVILCMGLGEFFRAFVLIFSFREIKYKINVRYINLNFFIQAYSYFIMGFATLLLYIADRVFVYISFSNIVKAEYQIFMNFLIFVVSVPNLLLIPFFKNYYKSRIKIDKKLQLSITLLGVTLTPAIIYSIYVACRYIYSIELSLSFILAGIFYIFPTFIYTPYALKLINKNKYINIAIVTFIAAASVALACSYLVKIKGVIGGLIGAAMGQWILMILIIVLDFQSQSEKKIKLIK